MRSIVTGRVAWCGGLSVDRSVTLVSSVKTAVWVEDLGGPREPRIRWRSRSPIGRDNFGRKKTRPIWTFCRELLAAESPYAAVQERLNRSICRLDCVLGLSEGSTSLIAFVRWRKCALNTIKPSVCGGNDRSVLSKYFDHHLLSI